MSSASTSVSPNAPASAAPFIPIIRFKILLTLVCGIIPVLGWAVSENPFRFPLIPGPWAVGFKCIEQYDHSRTFYNGYDLSGKPVSQNARPIQTCIWYPADAVLVSGTPRLKFGDYLALFGRQLAFPPNTPENAEKALRNLFQSWAIPEERQYVAQLETGAVINASPASGTFPIIIYAPSMNSLSVENDVLCEYLAGYGYIVVAAPSIGRRNQNLSMEIEDTETQARDIEFLISYIISFPGADSGNIALVGFSRGGMANVLTAMRDSRIKAIVCLDSSLRSPDHHLAKAPDYHPDKLTIPSLFMISREIPDEVYKKIGAPPPAQRTFTFYESLKYSHSWLIQFHKLVHYDFASGLIRLMEPDPLIAATPPEIIQGYAQVCRYVLEFLNGHLRGDQRGLRYLGETPEHNHIAAGLVTVRVKKAQEAPPAPGTFFARVRSQGFNQIGLIYNQLKTQFAGFAITPELFSTFGWSCVEDQQWDDAIAVYTFFVSEFPGHPQTYEAWYALGEAWRAKGRKAEARAAYEKAIALMPVDPRLKKRLETLND